MATLSRFRRAYTKLLPWWLTTEEGAKVNYTLGLLMDAYLTRLLQGLRARWPSYAMPSALPFLGRDRRIIRGINEPAEAYAARLLRWLDDHRIRGNPYALMEQLRAYCQADVRIRTVDMRGNWYTIERDGTREVMLDSAQWNWDAADPSRWSRFWVIIYPTSDGQPWERDGTWGDGAVWSDDAAEGTWGSTALLTEVESVRRIVREWKPAGTTCVRIIVAFADDVFVPGGAAETDGQWANHSKNDGGSQVAARDDRAIYWMGTAA